MRKMKISPPPMEILVLGRRTGKRPITAAIATPPSTCIIATSGIDATCTSA
jgi:hypothetical protein